MGLHANHTSTSTLIDLLKQTCFDGVNQSRHSRIHTNNAELGFRGAYERKRSKRNVVIVSVNDD